VNALLISFVALLETAVPVPAPSPVVAPPIAVSIQRPRVAIIDSGVAKTSELASLVSAEYDMASDPGRPEFQPRYDHGTMVATILARAAHGQVDIISFRIDDPAGCPAGANPPCQPSAAPVARAIRRAADLGVDAINISLALDKDPTITAAIADAAAKGIRVVLAAGNNGYDHPGNIGPARAAYPNAVLVGAIDSEGKPWSGTNRPDATPEGYNYSWQLGVKVPTAAIDGRAVTGTGTSFAVPLETAHFLASRTTASK